MAVGKYIKEKTMKRLPVYLPLVGPFYYLLYYRKRWGDFHHEDDIIKDEKDLILFFYHTYCFLVLAWAIYYL